MIKYKVMKDRKYEGDKGLNLKEDTVVLCKDYSDDKGDWPNWVLCEYDGLSSWVPKQYLSIDGDKARLLKDYNAVEMDVELGQILESNFSLNGWIWAINSIGESGWVPHNHLQIQCEYKIHRLNNKDKELLVAFERRMKTTEADIWLEAFNEKDYREKIDKADFDTDSNVVFYMKDETGMIARCDLVFYKSMMEFDTTAYIDWIYVEKSYRGRGLGQVLIEEAIKTAKSRGVEYCYLFTASNEEAKRFYNKQGLLKLDVKNVAHVYF